MRTGSPISRTNTSPPLPIAAAVVLLVVVSLVASGSDLPVLRTVATGGFVALIPIAAGLSVQRYRLYDVDRVLSRATTYVLASLVLAGWYVGVVAVVGRTLAGLVDEGAFDAGSADIDSNRYTGHLRT